MLRAHRLLDRDGAAITDVVCRHPAGPGHTDEADHHAIVFVRSGCFVRSADGASHLLDSTGAYCINPGQEQRYDHSHAHGDDCTSVRLAPTLLASLWGGDPTLPTDPVPSSPRIDLEHRLLLAAARRGETAHELFERTIALAAAALAQVDPGRVASGRPATDRAHTIARHRMRLRVRAALERLAGGEHRLAQLAADVGFVDQSHLSRVIRSETGQTPSALRRALG